MSVQILDFYHAVEHLWVVARMRFGKGSKAAAEWISLQQGRLLDDKIKKVIADIASWVPSTVAWDEVRERKLNYLKHHQDRMRYKTFRDAGFHIGSGVVEASCKSTVQGRMKGAGCAGVRKVQKGCCICERPVVHLNKPISPLSLGEQRLLHNRESHPGPTEKGCVA